MPAYLHHVHMEAAATVIMQARRLSTRFLSKGEALYCLDRPRLEVNLCGPLLCQGRRRRTCHLQSPCLNNGHRVSSTTVLNLLALAEPRQPVESRCSRGLLAVPSNQTNSRSLVSSRRRPYQASVGGEPSMRAAPPATRREERSYTSPLYSCTALEQLPGLLLFVSLLGQVQGGEGIRIKKPPPASRRAVRPSRPPYADAYINRPRCVKNGEIQSCCAESATAARGRRLASFSADAPRRQMQIDRGSPSQCFVVQPPGSVLARARLVEEALARRCPAETWHAVLGVFLGLELVVVGQLLV